MKVIVASVAAIIVLLVVIKALNFIPSEVATGTVSVKFQGVAPPTGQAPSQNTAELEKKIQSLQDQMQKTGAPQKDPPASPVSSVATAPAEAAPRQTPRVAGPPNIAGAWKSNLYNVQFVQFGNQFTMQVYVFGVLSAAGQGTISGNAVQVDYMNNSMMYGRMTGTISPDGSRMDMTDYGRGYPEQVVLVR